LQTHPQDSVVCKAAKALILQLRGDQRSRQQKRRPIEMTAELDRQLNEAVLNGEILQALERFYADDVTMQENDEPPTVGKAANLIRERDFINKVEKFNGAKLLSSAVSGDTSFSEWEIDMTYKAAGRFVLSQTAVRRWRDGQVVHERFYYKG
jgi:ketosteroid isomerase-like protein